MRSVCFYFQVHQPYRLRTYRFFDIGKDHNYYDEYLNRSIARRIAEKSYLPANEILLDIIRENKNAFKFAFSISGIALEQFEQYTPEVLDSFRKLAATGNVEFLAETYAHSLSSLYSKEEFNKQVKLHSDKIEALFGQKPLTFRNTELIYSDQIGEMVADMGFRLMLTEGAKQVLGWKSPNYMYTNANNPKLKLLLKNYRLSDDIAFRFSQQSWSEWPLTAEKFANWLNAIDPAQEVVNLFLDYETFGEHQWKETGIFDFLKKMPSEVLSKTSFSFHTPAELAKLMQPVSAIHVPHAISWADEERDLTAWLGNELQDEACSKLYELEADVNKCDDAAIISDWHKLQASDHFYYMCTKWFSDGDVHRYFNPYPSPYEAFINYMNVVSDFIIRLQRCLKQKGLQAEAVPEAVKPKEVSPNKPPQKASKKTSKPLAKEKLSFEGLMKVSKQKLKPAVRELDARELAVALYGAAPALEERLLSLITKSELKKYDRYKAKEALPSEKTQQRSRNKLIKAVLRQL